MKPLYRRVHTALVDLSHDTGSTLTFNIHTKYETFHTKFENIHTFSNLIFSRYELYQNY